MDWVDGNVRWNFESNGANEERNKRIECQKRSNWKRIWGNKKWKRTIRKKYRRIKEKLWSINDRI